MLCPHCTVHWVQCLNPSSFETVQLEACTWNLGPGGVWMYRNTLWFYTLNAQAGCHIQLLQNIWSQLNIRMLWGEWEEYDNHWESNPCQVAYLILASVVISIRAKWSSYPICSVQLYTPLCFSSFSLWLPKVVLNSLSTHWQMCNKKEEHTTNPNSIPSLKTLNISLLGMHTVAWYQTHRILLHSQSIIIHHSQLVSSLCASSLLCHFKVPKGFSIVLLGEVVLTKGKLSLCTAWKLDRRSV